MTQEHDASSDKSWQAFLYTEGEMSAEELTAFEARLENDTELCEQVAEAVILTDVIAAASHQPMLAKPVRTERFAAGRFWTSTILTACLMVALLVGNSLRTPSDSQDLKLHGHVRPIVEENISDENVIRLWVETSPTTLAEAEPFTGPISPVEVEELNVPDWLLAAVQYETVEETHEETPSLDREEI